MLSVQQHLCSLSKLSHRQIRMLGVHTIITVGENTIMHSADNSHLWCLDDHAICRSRYHMESIDRPKNALATEKSLSIQETLHANFLPRNADFLFLYNFSPYVEAQTETRFEAYHEDAFAKILSCPRDEEHDARTKEKSVDVCQ